MADRLKKERAAAHVTAAHELCRKEQAVAEGFKQDVHVFSRRYAAEEHYLGIAQTAQLGHIPCERDMVAGLVSADVHRPELTQILDPHLDARRHEPTIGGNHVHPRVPAGRAGESIRICEFAAKVQAAEEAEGLTQGNARGGTQPKGERKRGAVVEQQLRPLSTTVGRGKEEDSIRSHDTSGRLPRAIAVRQPVVGSAPANSGGSSQYWRE